MTEESVEDAVLRYICAKRKVVADSDSDLAWKIKNGANIEASVTQVRRALRHLTWGSKKVIRAREAPQSIDHGHYYVRQVTYLPA